MSKKINNDIIGTALLDYQSDNFSENITTYSSVAGKDEMELAWMFRSFDEMPMIERTALQRCEGKVLDVGCGAGCHTLFLQNKNYVVKAIDISKGAIDTCRKRGVKDAKVQNLMDLKDEKFNTILALMNGTGLCGKLENLENFLIHLKSLLTKNGQILIDSSNIFYMYADDFGDVELPDSKKYFGEVIFQLSYKEQFSDVFDWLFVDFNKLDYHSNKVGLKCQLIKEGYHHDYLAKLTIKNR
jgi:2-polyprenyl-3-methyl-5-hydroxy-6-metoxy-1,4-benzoquinol methylase